MTETVAFYCALGTEVLNIGNFNLNLKGLALTQAISRLPLTAEARRMIEHRSVHMRLVMNEVAEGPVFLLVIPFLFCLYYSNNAPY
jgi:hypothetical protein